MASFTPIKGTRAEIASTPKVEGQFLMETDQGEYGKVYLDIATGDVDTNRVVVGGVNRGIMNCEIKYAEGDEDSDPTTLSWQTSLPTTIQEGKYLWTRWQFLNADSEALYTAYTRSLKAVTPTASVTKLDDVATITITDKNGTTTATITDGFSPTATVTKTDKVATITITDKDGTTTETVSDGTDGQDGQNGNVWGTGTALTGTGTNLTGYAGIVGDCYLNTSTSNVYQCTAEGTDSTAKWSYICNIKGSSGSGTGDMDSDVYAPTAKSLSKLNVVDSALTLDGLVASVTELNSLDDIEGNVQNQLDDKIDNPSSSGTNGQALLTDGTGGVYWGDAGETYTGKSNEISIDSNNEIGLASAVTEKLAKLSNITNADSTEYTNSGVAGSYYTHNSKLWKALQNSSGVTPTEGQYWTEVNVSAIKDLLGNVSSASAVTGADAFSKINSLNTSLTNKMDKNVIVNPTNVYFLEDILAQAITESNSYLVTFGRTGSSTTNLPAQASKWKYCFVAVFRRGTYTWVEIRAYFTNEIAYNFHNGTSWIGWAVK